MMHEFKLSKRDFLELTPMEFWFLVQGLKKKAELMEKGAEEVVDVKTAEDLKRILGE